MNRRSEADPRPANITPEAWDFITQAVEYVHKLEIEILEDLLEQCANANNRAKGCGCPQCKNRAKRLTLALDEELARQTVFRPIESEIDLDEIERAIEFGVQKIQEKRNKDWDRRAKRLRQLIEKYLKEKANHNKDPFTEKERAEIKQLLVEARQRVERNRQRRGK